MAPYQWLSKTAAITALQGRLKNSDFWTSAELWLMLVEGLRHWNGLTEQWNSQLAIPNANGQWINTGTLTGSPRLRSLTDVDLLTQMEYMLLEPPSGGAWTGTNQFTLQNLQYCLQKRTQEVIQATSCNIAQLAPIASVPGTRRSSIADTVLQPRRIRFLALMAQTTGTASSGSTTVTVASATGIYAGLVIAGTNIPAGAFVTAVTGTAVTISLAASGAVSGAIQFFLPVTLTREDTEAFQSFEPSYQQTVGFPQSWAMASQPPLGFDVDIAPTTPGNYDVIALEAAPTFDPANAPSLLGIPDDWSMVPMYGALADVLSMESEASDPERATYCMNRYLQMLEMMKNSNWLLYNDIQGMGSDTTPLAEMDSYATGWQESQMNLPVVVEAGMDFVAPIPGTAQLVTLTMVGNAPLLDSTGTWVQVSRDDFEAILNYAQVTAAFKQGGSPFSDSWSLLKDFYRAAAARNSRWSTYGIFVDILREQGKLQQIAEPRESTNE